MAALLLRPQPALELCGTSANYERLGLSEIKKSEILGQREQMRAIRSKLADWQSKDDIGAARVSALCDLLRPLSLECLLYSMAAADDQGLQKNLSRYITQWRKEKADINGADLLRLGLEPGRCSPAFSKPRSMPSWTKKQLPRKASSGWPAS